MRMLFHKDKNIWYSRKNLAVIRCIKLCCYIYAWRDRQIKKKFYNPAPILTLASAAGFTFPNAKKAPPSMTILFTFLAKVESLLIAWPWNIAVTKLQSQELPSPKGKDEKQWKVDKTMLTKAKFVSGPSASIDTSPGYSETFSTKNSEALFSCFFAFGGGILTFPNPSEPWTKSATRGIPPYFQD